MANTPIVGHRCKLYRNTATVASPTWDLVEAVADLAVTGFGMGMAELKHRGSNWTVNLATVMKNFKVEGTIIAQLDPTTYAAMKSNVIAGTAEEYAVMNGDITTASMQGMRIPLLIEDFPTDQAMEKVVDHSITWVPAYFESPADTRINPSFYTVPA
jgi:hypothetical protein